MVSYVAIVLSWRPTKDLLEQNNFDNSFDTLAFVTPCSLKYEGFSHTFVHFSCTPQHHVVSDVVFVCCLTAFCHWTESLRAYSLIPVISFSKYSWVRCCRSRRRVISASEQVGTLLTYPLLPCDSVTFSYHLSSRWKIIWRSLKMQQDAGIDWQFDPQQVSLPQWLVFISTVSVPEPQTGT